MNFKETARTYSEPQLKFTQGGLAICEFGIVVPRYNAKKLEADGKQSADFLKCVAYGKTAEFVGNNVGKGKYITVEGDVQIDVTEDKKYYTKIKVDKVNIIEWKDKGTNINPDDDFSMLEDSTEDIPF